MSVLTKVIEVEADLLVIAFRGAKPPPESRPFWLHRTLVDWLADHSAKTVRRAQPIQDQGQLVGVLVWLGEPTLPKYDLPIRFDVRLKERLPLEHLEALCQQAYEVYFEQPAAERTLIVLNRGGIAVVFDRMSEAGYAVPFEDLQGIDEATRAACQRWMAKPNSKYHVLHLASGLGDIP